LPLPDILIQTPAGEPDCPISRGDYPDFDHLAGREKLAERRVVEHDDGPLVIRPFAINPQPCSL
jgi:hypothetical protein